MLKRQDRQGVRKASDVERKYNLQQLDGVNASVAEAKRAAASAEQAVDNLIANLDQEHIVSYLTDSGAAPAIYLIDGQLYIHASYIKQGVIKSADGEKVVIDLDKGTATFADVNTALTELEARINETINNEISALREELQGLGLLSV